MSPITPRTDTRVVVLDWPSEILNRRINARVKQMMEAGFLDEKQALHHEDRHLVSNFLGAAAMRIDVGAELQLQAMDTIMLASDGIMDNVHLDEIIDRIRKGPLDEAIDRVGRSGDQEKPEPRDIGPAQQQPDPDRHGHQAR